MSMRRPGSRAVPAITRPSPRRRRWSARRSTSHTPTHLKSIPSGHRISFRDAVVCHAASLLRDEVEHADPRCHIRRSFLLLPPWWLRPTISRRQNARRADAVVRDARAAPSPAREHTQLEGGCNRDFGCQRKCRGVRLGNVGRRYAERSPMAHRCDGGCNLAGRGYAELANGRLTILGTSRRRAVHRDVYECEQLRRLRLPIQRSNDLGNLYERFDLRSRRDAFLGTPKLGNIRQATLARLAALIKPGHLNTTAMTWANASGAARARSMSQPARPSFVRPPKTRGSIPANRSTSPRARFSASTEELS
jgi:hypothetical protein